MKYVIDEAVAEKLGLTIQQTLALMLIKEEGNIRWTLAELLDKGAIVAVGTPPTRYMITKQWSDLCDSVLLKADKENLSEESLYELADKLIELFPKGKKPGTIHLWRSSTREIASRLKSFFKKYNVLYDEETVLNATRRYVESFGGDYRFMRILKYFIWKKEDGEETSELATFIQNDDQEDETGDDWLTELR